MNTQYALDNARKLLSQQIKRTSDLLDILESEASGLNAYDREKFAKRLRVLDDMIDVATYYDEMVFKYVRFHPSGHNTQYLEEQLEVAKKYISRIGGDWNVVLWGKKADY